MALVTAMPLIFTEVEAPAAQPSTPAQTTLQSSASEQAPPAGTAQQTQPAASAGGEKPLAEQPAQEKTAEKMPAGEKPTAIIPAERTPAAETIPGVEKPPVQITDPFLGGTQARLSFSQKVDHQTVEELIKAALRALKMDDKDIPLEIRNDEYVEGSRTPYNAWTVKIGVPAEKAQEVFDSVRTTLSEAPFFPASNAIGGAVALGTRYQAFYALLASWLLIILYLWIRFQGVAFGVAAVVGLVHDVLVMLGAIAFSLYFAPYFGWLYIDPFKINLPIIAAFLTIIGYSVNDTIVVFDRIREVRGKDPNMTRKMVNDSTNQTLSRTLLTSLTVFIVVVVLYFFGGQALRGFSFALIAGVITGTYSSIYVSAPILLWLIGSGKTSQGQQRAAG